MVSQPNTLPCLLTASSDAEALIKDYIILIVFHISGIISSSSTLHDGHKVAQTKTKQLIASCYHWTTVLIHLCGHIGVNKMLSFSQHRWIIQPLAGYTTDITFHILNIFYSQRCEIISLGLLKIADCHHEEFYCGYLPSWNESCFCQSISVTLARLTPTTNAEIDLSYQISKKMDLTFFMNIHVIAMKMPISSSSLYNITTYIPQKVIMFIYSEHESIIKLVGINFDSGKFHVVKVPVTDRTPQMT